MADSAPSATVSTAPPGFGAVRKWQSLVLVLLAAAGGSAVALLSPLGATLQIAAVAGLALGPPGLLLFLVRPHLALAGYLMLLPLMVPVALVGGLNAGEMLTVSILLLGALSLWEARGRALESMRLLGSVLVPLAALAVVSVVSLVVNALTGLEDIVSALFKVLAFGLVAVLVHMHADTRAQARTLLGGAVAGATLVALYSVVAYILGWSYSEEYQWNRALGTFGNWNQLGGFMALMSPPTIALAALARGWMVRVAMVLAFVLQIAALLLSLTLGSMLGLVLGGGFTVLFLMPGGRRRVIPVLLLGALTFGGALAGSPELRDKLTRFDERLEDRLLTYVVGFNMFRDRVWWGFGSEQNLKEELLLGEADYGVTSVGTKHIIPHNTLLKVGVEKGVLGVLVFGLLLVGALRLLFRQRPRLAGTRDAPLFYGVAAGVLAFLVQNMTNDILLHARIGIVFFVLLALLDRISRTAHPASGRSA